MKKIISDLRFWIAIVLFLIGIGNFIVYSSCLEYNDKFNSYISLNGSLLGGLITLVSIFITNEHYNKERSTLEEINYIKSIKFKINSLEFLRQEFEVNKAKLIKYRQMLNSGGVNTIPLKETFQTIIWENSKSTYVEIFIDISENGLFNIQKFYLLVNEYKGIIQPIHIITEDLFDLIEIIEVAMETALKTYNDKLYKNDYEYIYKFIKEIQEHKILVTRIKKLFNYK